MATSRHRYTTLFLYLSLFIFILPPPVFGEEDGSRTVSKIEDFGDGSRWTSTRDANRLDNENYYYRFSAVPEAGRSGKGLRWEFKIRDPKQRYNDLYGNFQIEEPFDRISIWVRNPAKKPILFWMKLVEEDGSDFAPEPLGVPIGATSDWQRVEFRLDQYHVAKWSGDENN